MDRSVPEISVIIPHWNGIGILAECLEALTRSVTPETEIIVVDNASSDGSAAWIKQTYPAVILVENTSNQGYAGGCNRGAEIARGRYLVFLNNDTVQEPGWITHLAGCLDRDPSLAAVQPRLLNYFHRDTFDYAGGAGGHMDVLCFPFTRGRIFLALEKDRGQYDDAGPIFWASGTACMVRQDLFQAAGGFDEFFFAHMEEIDLCWRLQLMGYRIWYEPRAVVYHKNALSLPMQSFRKYYLNHRNSLFMLCTNYNLPLTLYLFPIRYALEWVALGYALVLRDWRHVGAILRAQLALVLSLRSIWRKRRFVRSLRRLKDRELVRNMLAGSIVLSHYLGRKQTYLEIASRPFR